MISPTRNIASAAAIALGLLALTPAFAADEPTGDVEAGKAIALDRAKGNCIACHQIEGGEGPGNIGPPLIAMQARYADPAVLRAQIWDSTAANPVSIMPPFGKHAVLSEQEIDQVVAFVLTL
jgi:sulfur-oxidizing protein SoxX